jgi:hypothetical protein
MGDQFDRLGDGLLQNFDKTMEIRVEIVSIF